MVDGFNAPERTEIPVRQQRQHQERDGEQDTEVGDVPLVDHPVRELVDGILDGEQDKHDHPERHGKGSLVPGQGAEQKGGQRRHRRGGAHVRIRFGMSAHPIPRHKQRRHPR